MTPTPITTVDTTKHDRWRPLRYFYRLPLLALLALFGLPLTLLVTNPLGAKIRLANDSLDQRAIRWWSRGLCWVFGLRVRSHGEPAQAPVMLVANHLSWLDIQVIHSIRAAVFVGKAEIASWPLLGWMAKAGGTIFLRRGSADSLNWVAECLAEKLDAGHTVAIFPEAGTGDGRALRRFHARLLKAAVLADQPMQPVALRYVRNGRHNLAIPFAPGESLVANMVRLLGGPVTEAQLRFLPVLEHHGRGRRELAGAAQTAVAEAYREGLPAPLDSAEDLAIG